MKVFVKLPPLFFVILGLTQTGLAKTVVQKPSLKRLYEETKPLVTREDLSQVTSQTWYCQGFAFSHLSAASFLLNPATLQFDKDHFSAKLVPETDNEIALANLLPERPRFSQVGTARIGVDGALMVKQKRGSEFLKNSLSQPKDYQDPKKIINPYRFNNDHLYCLSQSQIRERLEKVWQQSTSEATEQLLFEKDLIMSCRQACTFNEETYGSTCVQNIWKLIFSDRELSPIFQQQEPTCKVKDGCQYYFTCLESAYEQGESAPFIKRPPKSESKR